MPRKSSKCQKIFRRIFIGSIILTIIIFWVQSYDYFFGKETKITTECGKDKNTAVIGVHGDIVTYGDIDETGRYLASSEKIVEYINQADKNRKIKAIILDIDSLGGSPVAGEEIANALKKIKKPTVAVIRGAGDSAAYIVATGAQKIYASKFSEVGNIGITMSYLDYSQKNTMEGLIYQELSSGKFKDIANPNKTLTDEERQLLLNYVKGLKEIFIDIVSQNRNLERIKVQEMADGSIMTAEEAKTRGLIDEIGGLEEVKEYLKNEFKIKPEFCFIESF